MLTATPMFFHLHPHAQRHVANVKDGVACRFIGQSTAVAGRVEMMSSRRTAAASAFAAIPLRQRKVHSRERGRKQDLVVVAQAAPTAEAALKETDLHGDLKKALANVKPKVAALFYPGHCIDHFAAESTSLWLPLPMLDSRPIT